MSIRKEETVTQHRKSLVANRRLQQRRNRLVALLICIVVVVTALALMIPAVSLTEDAAEEIGIVLDNDAVSDEPAAEAPADTLALEPEEEPEAEPASEPDPEFTEEPSETPASPADDMSGNEADAGDAFDGNQAGVSVDVDENATDTTDTTEYENAFDGANDSNDPISTDDSVVEDLDELDATDATDCTDDYEEPAEPASSVGTVDPNSEDAEMPAQTFTADLKDSKDRIILTVAVDAPEGAFPAGTFMEIDGVAPNMVKDKVEEAIERSNGENVKIKNLTAVDIVFKDVDGMEIEPAKKVEVKITTSDVSEFDDPVLVHVLDKSKESSKDKSNDAEVVKKVSIDTDYDTVEFESKAFSPYVIAEFETITAGVITADGAAYAVAVNYDANAGIPADAELRVVELLESGRDWTDYVDRLTDELGVEPSFARLFDISIVDGNGNEIQPNVPVEVSISLDNVDELTDGVKVAHFADESDSIDVINANLSGDTVAFDAEGFSVYAVIGGTEPTARMKLEFHAKDPANGNSDVVVATMYVKKSDTAEDLETIIYDPSVGAYLQDNEFFRGWTFKEGYTITDATTHYDSNTNKNGAMTIDDIRDWVISKQQAGITEGEVIDFYAITLHSYTVHYEAPAIDGGAAIAVDSAYMLRGDTVANYKIDKTYTPNDTSHYNFQGWIINKFPAEQGNVQYDGTLPEVVISDVRYKLYEIPKNVTISGDVTFTAYAPYGNWLIFHEVKKGATYTAAKFLEPRQSASLPTAANMNLLGYTFEGWYTNYDESQNPPYSGPVDELPGYDEDNGTLTISGETNLYAKWDPVEWAPYTVIIWQEDLDQADPDHPTYSYAESVQCYGTVGTKITIGNSRDGSAMLSKVDNKDADYLYIYGQDKDHNEKIVDKETIHTSDGTPQDKNVTHTYINEKYVGFNCVGFKNENGEAITSTADSVTINPEGNTVVNVYYDRIEYTVKIYFASTDTNAAGNYQAGDGYHLFHYRAGTDDAPLAPNNMDNRYWYDVNDFPYKLAGPDDCDYDEVNGKKYYYTTVTGRYGENIAEQWPQYVDFNNGTARATHGSGDTLISEGDTLTMISWYMSSDAGGYRGKGSGLNTFKGVITIMDEKILGDINVAKDPSPENLRDYQNILVARYDKTVYYYNYEIWKEQLEGVDYAALGYETRMETKKDNDGTTREFKFYLSNDDCFVAHSSATDGKKATQAPVYRGFKNLEYGNIQRNVESGTGTAQTPVVCEFYYERIKNPIVYRDGSYYTGDGARLDLPAHGGPVESDPYVYYEDSIASYGPTGGENGEPGSNYYTDYPSSYDGFVFEGWYMDAECTQPYPFGTAEKPAIMPDHAITVYAKFVQVQYRVFLHPNVPEIPDDVYIDWGNDDQKMNFRISHSDYVSEPTGFLRYANGDLYEEWEFGGWYFDEDYTQPFLGTAYPLNESIDQLEPYDKTDPTDNMDVYGNIDERSPHPEDEPGPGYNSDKWKYDEDTGVFTPRDRWWITEKLNLYAKWNKNLHQSKIEVEYDLNGGTYGDPPSSDIVVDRDKYIDNSDAVAMDAPNPSDPTKEVFRYWVLQKWVEDPNEAEGGKFVDCEPIQFVSPTDTFRVSVSNAHVYVEGGETKYKVRLRAEYGPLKEETPTHIYWYSNFGENQVVKKNDTDAAQNVEHFRINEAVNIKPATTFTRKNFKFLGWARVNSTNDQGVPLEDEPKLHPELDADDLFLKYVEAQGDVAAHFEAKNKDGDWVSVTQVAADEVMPYHNLYAVWGIDLEIVKTNNGTTPITGAKFDLYQGERLVATIDLTQRSSSVVSNLFQGEYRLEETTIPNGYIVTGDVCFEIDETNEDGIVMVTSNNKVTSPDGEQVPQAYTAACTETKPAQLIVRNEPSKALPNTGGTGTAFITLVGIMLVVAAAAIYIGGRRPRIALAGSAPCRSGRKGGARR